MSYATTLDEVLALRSENAKLKEQLVKCRETLAQANAFIIATHFAPAIQPFEIEARQKHYDALIKRIDSTLTDEQGETK